MSKRYNFRHRWVIVKFFAVIAMIMVGMFFTEQKMLANLALLEKEDAGVWKKKEG